MKICAGQQQSKGRNVSTVAAAAKTTKATKTRGAAPAAAATTTVRLATRRIRRAISFDLQLANPPKSQRV